MRHARVAAAVIAGAGLLLTGCSSSTSKPAAAPAGQTPPATSVAVPATSSVAAAPDGLTGFGATQQAWDAHHTADPDKTAAGVYNQDPALPKTKDGQVNDDYVGVTADGGRVDSYNLVFTARPVAAALAAVKAELPADATLTKPVVTAGLVDSKCLILTATSATVGKALGGASGLRIEVELQSWDPTVLDQSAIMSAVLVTANKGDAPGC